MAAASMESCRFVVLRSLGDPSGSALVACNRLRRRFQSKIHLPRSFFFFRVLDLTAENNPPISGRKKTLSVRRTLRACLAGASAPTRPDVPTRVCRRLALPALRPRPGRPSPWRPVLPQSYLDPSDHSSLSSYHASSTLSPSSDPLQSSPP